MEYRPLIEKIKIQPSLVDTEGPLNTLEAQISELTSSKNKFEAAKLSCERHIKMASLAIDLANDVVSSVMPAATGANPEKNLAENDDSNMDILQ